MLKFILSPAKKMADSVIKNTYPLELPLFLLESDYLVKILREDTIYQLASRLDISDKLSRLNWQRYQDWSVSAHHTSGQAALFLYQGDVYKSLAAETFSTEQVDWLQKRLAIISGLYGLLHPLHAILPYRLEMSAHIRTMHHRDLYAYWKFKLSAYCHKWAKNNVLVQLASQEYSQVLSNISEKQRMITPVFENWHRSDYHVVGLLAKKARGLMLRSAVQEGWEDPEQLKDFCANGYQWNRELSTDTRWVFRQKSIIFMPK